MATEEAGDGDLALLVGLDVAHDDGADLLVALGVEDVDDLAVPDELDLRIGLGAGRP